MFRVVMAGVLFSLAFCAKAVDTSIDMKSDNRIAISVSNGERNQVLFEMRAFLQGLYNIQNAMADKDMKRVANSARALGPLLNRVPSTMRDRLPVEFLELGNALRESFEAVAKDAESNKDMTSVQSHLAETVAYCAGCHETFRFQVKNVASRK